MTRVFYDEANFCLSMTGHSMYAPRGEDLICAALSVLMFTLEEAVMDHKETMLPTVSHADGGIRIQCRPKDKHKRTCRTIFRTIYTGCELMSSRFPEYVQTSREQEGN